MGGWVSFIHSLIHSSINPSTHPFIPSFIHPPTHPPSIIPAGPGRKRARRHHLQHVIHPSTHPPTHPPSLPPFTQPALEGNALVAIICNISPSVVCLDETHNTLKFASRYVFPTHPPTHPPFTSIYDFKQPPTHPPPHSTTHPPTQSRAKRIRVRAEVNETVDEGLLILKYKEEIAALREQVGTERLLQLYPPTYTALPRCRAQSEP